MPFKPDKVFCFFEQSGTFKNEFIKLGLPAIDVDICDDFGQTDIVTDIFNEIGAAEAGDVSIFDCITPGCLIIAFFPCVRFSHWIKKHIACTCNPQYSYPPIEKLDYSMRIERERSEFYQHLCRFVRLCLVKGVPLIIENPYNEDGYLAQFFPFLPGVVDYDRRRRGDCFVKPTQFFFFNLEPSYNFIFEPGVSNEKKIVEKCSKVDRSMITSDYANRFIREFIL